MSTPSFVAGIGAFADRYQGFLLDQWGVIHDGQRALPAALAALNELKRRNKRLVVLSNSGRRAELNRRRLAEMGFNVAMFDAVVTSGEAAWQALERRNLPGFAELGRHCLLFTIGGDLGVVADLGLDLVDTPEQADFVFLTGTEIPPLTLDDYRAILERAARLGLPMVCSNPDHVAPSGTELVIAPGTVAAIYEAIGGTVRYIGKPHAPIYGACLDALEGLELGEIVAVGDSLEHDIKGANNIGIASCFLTGGIHAGEFPAGATRADDERQLAKLSERHAATPDWVVPRLSW